MVASVNPEPGTPAIGYPLEERLDWLRLQVEFHDHSEVGIKAVIGFRVAGLLDSWADLVLVLRQDSESEMLMQRPIPWNMPEGRERER